MQDRSHHTHVGDHLLHPETLMLGYGYDPTLSEGSVKPPVFLTSTFVFRTAEEGKDFFDYVSGRKTPPEGGVGLIYSRFNHPNSEILEDRLAIFEGGEASLVFASGMAAISTAILTYARPNDVILHSQPLYGGTETLLIKTLQPFNVLAEGFADGLREEAVEAAAQRAMARGRVSIILLESPSNPLNTLVDFEMIGRVADKIRDRQGMRPLIMCDNTLLGPVFQKPLQHGVDISLYSLTKYVGGHSDLIAGAAIGSRAILQPIRALRGAIGTQLDPHSCWMLGRSLETLSLRMNRASENAGAIAAFLSNHPSIDAVHGLHTLPDGSMAAQVFQKQCTGPGSTFSLEVKGGQSEAFRMLNALRVFKLAVSLGGTESLACHPASTTHSGVPIETRQRVGVTESTVRLSIGIEHPDDLIADLTQALHHLKT